MELDRTNRKKAVADLILKIFKKNNRSGLWISVPMLRERYKISTSDSRTIGGLFRKYYRNPHGVDRLFYINDRIKNGGHYIYYITMTREEKVPRPPLSGSLILKAYLPPVVERPRRRQRRSERANEYVGERAPGVEATGTKREER